MAIIYSYPEKITPAGGDFLVITDSEQPAPNKNRTKSLKIDNLADYIVTSTSGITGSGTLNTIAMFTPDGQSIGDSILTQDVGATQLTVTGELRVSKSIYAVLGLTIDGATLLNGNVTLGDNSADLITQTGTLYLNGPVKDTSDTLGDADQILVSDASGELTFTDLANISIGAAEVVQVPVKNLQGSALTKGDPVYISGSVGASGRLEVQLADASNAAKMPAVGLLKQDLDINEEGFAVVTGKLRNLDNSTIDGQPPAPNDVVYVKASSTTGNALTLVKPVGSALIQNMGKVGRVSNVGSNDGTFVVSSILRTNDIPNLTPGKIWVGSTGNTIESSSITFTEATGAVQLDEYGTATHTGTTAYNLAVDAAGNVIETPHTLEDLLDTEIESGRVRHSTLTTPGSGYTVANNVPTTGGNGTGLEINILTLGVGDSIATYSIAPIRDGANYVAGDVVTVNAGNVDATITIDETWPLGGNTLVYNTNDDVWINDATLTVDYINKRVGIGTTNPTIGFHCDPKAKFRNEVRIDQKNNNAILGQGSNYDNLIGNANTAVGTNVMGAAVAASNNTAVGYNAFAVATGGNNNAVFGSGAGSSIVNGSFNVALGAYALPAAINTQANIAIGYNAQQSNTSGNNNIAIGRNALGTINGYFSNTVIGTDAARLTFNMNRAVVIGSEALGVGTTGSDVVLVGNQAGQNNNAQWTVAIGSRALQANTRGFFNTAVGGQALSAVTGGIGRYNAALGYQAGNNITNGQNNIVIGFQAQASSATTSNEITLGNSSISVLRCAVTTITSLSDERDKTDITNLEYGLDFINSLSPKQFTWDQRPEYAIEIDDDGNETQVEVENANKGKKDFGFIAQDVQSVDNDILRLVYAENPEKLEMSYGKLVPILVQAIKELTNRIEALEA